MYRISHCLVTARSLLFRRQAVDTHLVYISNTPYLRKYQNPKERKTCPVPPPPPPPSPKDDRLLWGTVTLLFLAGGFAVYAHESPEVRDWLSIHAPWFDDIIAIIYQENVSFSESASKILKDAKAAFIKYVTEDPDELKTCQKKHIVVRPDPECRDTDDAKLEKGPPPKICEEPPPVTVTKTICEIEFCIKEASETTLNNYITARDACRYFNGLVEDVLKNFDMIAMKSVLQAIEERIILVKNSLANACEAKTELDELARYLDCGVKAPKEHIESTKSMLAEYRNKHDIVFTEYQWANQMSEAVDIEIMRIYELVKKYTDENVLMFQDLNYEGRKQILKGDPDLLLHHTLRYLKHIETELHEGTEPFTDRINRALSVFPNPEKQKKEINYLYAKKRSELDREYAARLDSQKKANDKLLKDLLKKQLEKHEETLTRRLKEKEVEATIKLNKMVAEKVAAEKKIFAIQLREMAIKLKYVDDKLNARLKAERETRRSQELWTAGASLLAATKRGDPYVNVDKEIRAIERAVGDGDKLVMTVLKAIPESVRQMGVVPESVLRAGYHSMESTALSVALVEEDGAPLLVFFLSWIQSWLLFMKLSGIPQKEFENPPKEPSKELDTFDLLNRARFYIERNNLALALRYVSSLEGASRAAAAKWAEATRSHLETRQAAEAIIAHAVALGLKYI